MCLSVRNLLYRNDFKCGGKLVSVICFSSNINNCSNRQNVTKELINIDDKITFLRVTHFKEKNYILRYFS